jgi:hypothetical protein
VSKLFIKDVGGRWDSNPVPRITGPVLGRLSYGHHRFMRGLGATRLELASPSLVGRRSVRLSYAPNPRMDVTLSGLTKRTGQVELQMQQ